tara:strand:- start:9362 stop:9493 length:132 start_codon:yes stop_codon:yes gene_type:complete
LPVHLPVGKILFLVAVSVEEMAVITENGAEYLIAPQEEVVLVE